MRRTLMCALVAGLVGFGTVAPAAAAPVKTVRDAVDVNCLSLAAPGGTAFLQVSTRPDGGVFTTIWRAGDVPNADEPWLSGTSPDAVFDGSSLQATVPLVDLEAGGAEYGDGVIDATLSASGTPEVISVRGGQGNVRSRSTTTITQGSASGTFAVPGVGVFDLGECSVELLHIESFQSNPAAYVENLAPHVSVACTFDGSDSDLFLFAEGFLPGERGEVEVSVWQVPDGSEEANLGGGGLASLTRTGLDARVDLVDAAGEPAGTAVVDARLSVVGRQRIRFNDGPVTYSTRIETLEVEGTLSLSDGRTFAMEDCLASREFGQQRSKPARRED